MLEHFFSKRTGNRLIGQETFAPKRSTRFFGFILSFSILGFVGGCNDELVQPQALPENYQRLLDDINSTEVEIAQGRLLRKSSKPHSQKTKQILVDMRASVLRLGVDQNDRSAAVLLYRSGILNLGQVSFTLDDKPRFQSLQRQTNDILNPLAKRHQLNMNVGFPIWTNRFSDDLGSFQSASTFTDWASGYSAPKDRFSARGTGQDNRAWLYSPPLDLRNTNRPKLRFFHSININRNTGRFSGDSYHLRDIIRGVFKVCISTNYEGGNPDAKGVQWKRLPIEVRDMPTAKEFHSRWSPEIDLSKYRNVSKITLAFLFDHNATKDGALGCNKVAKISDVKRRVGRHYIDWYISQVEIIGTGNVLELKRDYFEYTKKFDSKQLAPFRVFNFLPGNPEWRPAGRSRNGPIEWVIADSFRKKVSTALLSPRFDLTGAKEAKMKLKEVFRGVYYKDVKILYSTDYKEGEPFTDGVTWHEYPRDKKEGQSDPERFQTNLVEIDLLEKTQSAITFAFDFTTEDKGHGLWEILEFSVTGRDIPAQPQIVEQP